MKLSRIALLGVALSLFGTLAEAQAILQARNPNPQVSAQGSGPFATAEARRAVPPIPFPTYGPAAQSQRVRDDGTTGASPGQAPSPEAVAEAATRFAAERAQASGPAVTSDAGSDFAASPGIYTQYCENCDAPITDYPRSAIGKLFFDTDTGSASCTGTLIGNRVVVTAAHCCYGGEGPNFFTNFTFVPDYRNGDAPFGTWNYTSARVLASYRTNPGRANDMCLIRFGQDGNNRFPGYYTGWLGYAWGMPYAQNLHAVGYPGNIGGGNFMELCTSQTNRPGGGCERNNVLNMGCSMTYGASGGPWVSQYRGELPYANYVVATVSGIDDATCTGVFGEAFNGPRFVTGNIGRLCSRGSWC